MPSTKPHPFRGPWPFGLTDGDIVLLGLFGWLIAWWFYGDAGDWLWLLGAAIGAGFGRRLREYWVDDAFDRRIQEIEQRSRTGRA